MLAAATLTVKPITERGTADMMAIR